MQTQVILYMTLMNESNILITGGAGLLGSELCQLLPKAQAPNRDVLDVNYQESIIKYFQDNKIDLVIHCAAYMPPMNSDKHPEEAIRTNIVGTSSITIKCIQEDIRLFYISTDYVYKGDKGDYKEDSELLPVNRYAWSKLGGECAVRMYPKGLVIHTTFGPKEFPYEKAFTNQWTSKETVDVIAKKIAGLVDSDVRGVLNVGGSRNTIYEYAKRISPNKKIGKLTREDMLPNYVLPKDTSLNTDKYKIFKVNQQKEIL